MPLPDKTHNRCCRRKSEDREYSDGGGVAGLGEVDVKKLVERRGDGKSRVYEQNKMR